jgi:hypothetical protein
MDKEDYFLIEKQLLPTEGRIILSIDKALLTNQPFGILNKGYTIAPSEITLDTISEDDLDWGEKGLVSIKFYKTSSEKEYHALTATFMNDNSLVVEACLYSDLDEQNNYSSLFVTSGWDTVPDEEDIVFTRHSTENKFIIVAIFSNTIKTKFYCVIQEEN